jgi:erythritol transport system ATP-binding protein
VFRILAARAAAGQAVIYTTSEVNECLSIAHRIVIMRRGRISAEFGSDIGKDKIMAASGEAEAA